MSAFELIIFDCDGVLVDSERLANKVFAQILMEECGLCFDQEEMFNTFVGRSSGQCMSIVEEMTGSPPPVMLAQRYHDDINAALSRSVKPVKGIERVLDQLSTRYCVASSGSHEKMRMTLGRTALLPYFEGRIFSASEVERGKPFPDIYLHAARNMGCEVGARCLVIEDSPAGVEGGVAAGMVVFGFAELMSERKLIDSGAHRTFDSMAELVNTIAAYEQAAA